MKRTPLKRKTPLKGWRFVDGKAVKPKRRKASERTVLRKALDRDFSLYVRLRDKRRFGGKCAFGCGRPLEVAFHFLSRGNLGTRWDPRNSVGSCKGCNMNEFLDRREAAKAKWREHHVRLVGETTRLDLEAKAKAICKMTDDGLRALLADIRRKMETVLVEPANPATEATA